MTCFGRRMGSRSSFSCNSSIRLTFHLSRWTCQVPKANVNIGTIPTRIINGLNSEFLLAFKWNFELSEDAVDSLVVDSSRLEGFRGFIHARRLKADNSGLFRRKHDAQSEEDMTALPKMLAEGELGGRAAWVSAR